MAGVWIKMRVDLATDPAVIGMAAELDVSEFEVVGMLHHLWSWADIQSRDGHAPGVTTKWINRYVQCDGFAERMQAVGWLEIDHDGIRFPKFDRHNGESAKKRGLATNRKQAQRSKDVTKVTPEEGQTSRTQRDKNATREDEDKNKDIGVVVTPQPPTGAAEPPPIETADNSAIGKLRTRLSKHWKIAQLLRPESAATIGSWVAMGATPEDIDAAIVTATVDSRGNPKPLPASPNYLTPIIASLIDARVNPAPPPKPSAQRQPAKPRMPEAENFGSKEYAGATPFEDMPEWMRPDQDTIDQLKNAQDT